ncbi:hypothetical protein IFM89_038267 [Coptis chinensis]|uniref:Pheophorbide a oxygenase domain-containing protein n=1 Tax=Coptis chinensis TaxID=261450 RepID=A0A835HB59_9MAGN|nr:hypothetical protein IFM89_038267 [Coptis chinensis]
MAVQLSGTLPIKNFGVKSGIQELIGKSDIRFIYKISIETLDMWDMLCFIRDPSENVKVRRLLLIYICVPVSPGNSRLIWAFPRNFGVWIDAVVPRWMFHVGQNLLIDSDLYLVHLEERKITDIGPSNWQKAYFVQTKTDALVVLPSESG